jgi:hypothetical protein
VIDPIHHGGVDSGGESSVRATALLGDAGGGTELVSTWFQSQTSLVGSQVIDGNDRRIVSLGVGFMYRHERLTAEWDRVGAAHLIGGQFLLTHSGTVTARWEGAAYGDFALVQAHVFGPTPPFPQPPPFRSALQADGYYDAFGFSTNTRLRLELAQVQLVAEGSLHRWWQVAGADRDPMVERTASASAIPATPTGANDWRAYWRVELGYVFPDFVLGIAGNGAYRRGGWQDLVRVTSDRALTMTIAFDL